MAELDGSGPHVSVHVQEPCVALFKVGSQGSTTPARPAPCCEWHLQTSPLHAPPAHFFLSMSGMLLLSARSTITCKACSGQGERLWWGSWTSVHGPRACDLGCEVCCGCVKG